MFEEIYREIAYKPIDKMSKRELDLFNFFLENLLIQDKLRHLISAINAGMPITEEDIKEYLGISNMVPMNMTHTRDAPRSETQRRCWHGF